MLSLSPSSAATGPDHALHHVFTQPEAFNPGIRSVHIRRDKCRVSQSSRLGVSHPAIRPSHIKAAASTGDDFRLPKQNETKNIKLPSSNHDIPQTGENDERLNSPTDGLLQADVDELQNHEQDCDCNSWDENDRWLLDSLLHKLESLRFQALALEQWNASNVADVDGKYVAGARNLLHFMALHSLEIQEVQKSLSHFGLSKLDRIDSNILDSLNRVIDAARALSVVYSTDKIVDNSRVVPIPIFLGGKPSGDRSGKTHARSGLHENSLSLFGPTPSGRQTYIMVTLSEEVADDESTVLDLMKAGMNLARINCAHGNPEVWNRIIRTVKHCSQMLEHPCRVLMDLAGPKIRTSSFPPGRRLRKIKPYRNEYGMVTTPARVWMALPGTPVPNGMSADAVVPVEGEHWLGKLQVGDQLNFTDMRGKLRQVTVTEKIMGTEGVGCWVECYKTVYLESGTELKLSQKRGRHDKGHVSDLPCVEQFIRVKRGDLIILSKETLQQPLRELSKNKVHRVQVSQTFGQLFDSVRPGELVRFDDGKIEGVIQCISPLEITVEVTSAKEKGTKLGGQRSINLPENNFYQKGLTVKDLMDLDFIVGHADLVGLSFVNNSKDVQLLQHALEKRRAADIGVVLKIETKSGIESLLEILFQGMKMKNPLGVMIARGDLAVECGWKSLANLQEELLCICTAAHIPGIWATQVLEGLSKEGLATRPEITDAAAGRRASCILLNKGSYIVKAVSLLDNMLSNSSQDLSSDITVFRSTST